MKSRRALTIALCATMVFLAFVYRLISDTTIWGEWLSIGPPVLWAALFAPSVVRSKSWVAAAFLLVFLLITTEWPRFPTKAAPLHDNTIRLISWNIGAGNGNWADALETLEPDIVLIQESMKPTEAWDGYQWYGTPDPGALLRYPVEVLPTEKVGPWTEPHLLLARIGNQKVLLANVRLMLPSAVIQLVEPLHQNPFENYRARITQYEKLARLLKSTADRTDADAIILAGDFNVPARVSSLEPLRAFLRDAWRVAGSGWGATMPEFLPLTRIDHVWMSKGINIVSVRVHRLAGSDHRAVIVDFKLS